MNGVNGERRIRHECDLDLDKTGFDIVEEGVRDLVIALWRNGYNVFCSCAGHLYADAVPSVVVRIREERELNDLFKVIAIFNGTRGRNGKLPIAADTWILSPQYLDDMSFAFLRPQSVNSEARPEELERLRTLGRRLARVIETSS